MAVFYSSRAEMPREVERCSVLSRKPWDDLPGWRAVLGCGLDRESMARAAPLGYGCPPVSLVSHGLRGHVSLLEMYSHNDELQVRVFWRTWRELIPLSRATPRDKPHAMAL